VHVWLPRGALRGVEKHSQDNRMDRIHRTGKVRRADRIDRIEQDSQDWDSEEGRQD
jgi:hypothetical protein